jgi:hypothetical protein
MEGSPDGSTWTVLDTEIGQTNWQTGWDIPEVRTFSATGSTGYRYFQLNITANNSGGGDPNTAVGELYLFGAPAPDQASVSKAILYAVIAPPGNANVSKAILYAVVMPGTELAITCGSPPPGTYGVPYSHTFPSSGGTAPFTFEAVTYFGVPVPLSLIPWGLSLDSATGVISGTPILVGTLYLTIQVTDSLGAVANTGFYPGGCSITINSTLAVICDSPPAGTVGTTYAHAFPASGDAPPYTWSIPAGSLPTGLSLDTATGMVAGTPTAAGTFPFTVGVSDTLSGTASVDCSITIAGATPLPPAPTSGDVLTGRIFQYGAAPTKMRLSAIDSGLTAVGDRSLRLSPQRDVTHTLPRDFMLHRNGLLLTQALDYTVSGPWISLVTAQAILDTDSFTAVISMGGEACSTFDGSISGAVDGANYTFVLPFAPTETMLFRNGLLLTNGLDYVQIGSVVTLFSSQIPLVTDVLTAHLWRSGGPVQVTTWDDTLDYAEAALVWPFRNGLRMAVPLDAVAAGNMVTFTEAQVDDVLAVRAWTPNVSDPDMPPLNLPAEFRSDDGSISGLLNGVNNLFTLRTRVFVAQIMLNRNGVGLSEGSDYSWVSAQTSSSGEWTTVIEMRSGQLPQPGDLLIAGVFQQ